MWTLAIAPILFFGTSAFKGMISRCVPYLKSEHDVLVVSYRVLWKWRGLDDAKCFRLVPKSIISMLRSTDQLLPVDGVGWVK